MTTNETTKTAETATAAEQGAHVGPETAVLRKNSVRCQAASRSKR